MLLICMMKITWVDIFAAWNILFISLHFRITFFPILIWFGRLFNHKLPANYFAIAFPPSNDNLIAILSEILFPLKTPRHEKKKKKIITQRSDRKHKFSSSINFENLFKNELGFILVFCIALHHIKCHEEELRSYMLRGLRWDPIFFKVYTPQLSTKNCRRTSDFSESRTSRNDSSPPHRTAQPTVNQTTKKHRQEVKGDLLIPNTATKSLIIFVCLALKGFSVISVLCQATPSPGDFSSWRESDNKHAWKSRRTREIALEIASSNWSKSEKFLLIASVMKAKFLLNGLWWWSGSCVSFVSSCRSFYSFKSIYFASMGL